MRNKLKKIIIAALWLAVWQVAALWTDNDILLAGPVKVLGALFEMAGKPFVQLFTGAPEADFYFYEVCWSSLKRILLGFVMAFAAGSAFGALSFRFPFVRDLGEPALAVMKSIPVASFVVLLLIWQGSENLSVWISFFVAFPNLCVSARNGLEHADPKLKEMAEVFGIRGIRSAVFIYRPPLLRFLRAGMEVCVGMAFKSGVAAEVIGVPDYSVGERIYVSKIYLDTPGLFAWTISLILISFAVERLILWGIGLLERPVPAGGVHLCEALYESDANYENGRFEESDGSRRVRGTLMLSHIFKAFGEKEVLSDVNAKLSIGERYLLMGPSGSGKTTTLRILAGLEKPDRGQVETVFDTGEEAPGEKLHVSYLFQEDRLLENEFTITNIMLPIEGRARCSKKARTKATRTKKVRMASLRERAQAAAEILPESCFKQPAGTLSGGMKRRCALARALFYQMDNPAAVCLLDEPFAGLDQETKERAAKFIGKYLNGRTLIVATHDEKDAQLLGGSIWRIAE